MFDYKHYIPILRWKRAEWIALRNLHEEEKTLTTPLLEIVPKDFKPRKNGNVPSIEQVAIQKIKEIKKNWGTEPFFLDLWLLTSESRSAIDLHFLELMGMYAQTQKLSLIPVTGLNRNTYYQSKVSVVLKTNQRGVCIRILHKDIYHKSFKNDLDHLLTHLNLRPEQVDFLVDYQTIDISNSINFDKLCNLIPYLENWRTFTISSGAFPKNLSDLEKNRQHILKRIDWVTWRNQISKALPRLPSFSDYTIQHGLFSEPPERANFSASIRYTTDEDWIIMRGEGVFNDDGPGFAQWPANAELLCLRSEFCGESFSYGDEYIKTMSLQTKKTGSAETWLRAGINHHLTFVVRQIASFFGISTVGKL